MNLNTQLKRSYKMDGDKIEVILEKKAFFQAKYLKLEWRLTFQQNNDPKHASYNGRV